MEAWAFLLVLLLMVVTCVPVSSLAQMTALLPAWLLAPENPAQPLPEQLDLWEGMGDEELLAFREE